MKLAKIKNIRKIGKRKVYDISVPINNNFILDNLILSHNSETKGIVSGAESVSLLCKMNSQADREEACKVLLQDNLMTKEQVSELSTLKPGEVMFVESGKPVKKRYFFMPRTLFWEPGIGTFFKNWQKFDGNWLNIAETKDSLEMEYKVAHSEIMEKIKFEKVLHAKEQEKKKKEAEERELAEREEKLKREMEIEVKVRLAKDEKIAEAKHKQQEKLEERKRAKQEKEAAKKKESELRKSNEKMPEISIRKQSQVSESVNSSKGEDFDNQACISSEAFKENFKSLKDIDKLETKTEEIAKTEAPKTKKKQSLVDVSKWL